MPRVLVVAAVAGVLLTGCSRGSTADATWTMPAGEKLDPSTTTFAVDVTRFGCNGGVTGTVNEPDIRISDDRVIITFTVSPGDPPSAACPGNEVVPHDVVLPEPLGTRKLVDGVCELDRYATTAPCSNGGLRYPN